MIISSQELHAKKLHCLKTMLEVAKLEEDCGVGGYYRDKRVNSQLFAPELQRLSNTMDCRAVELVKPETRTGKEGDQAPSGGPNLPGFIAASAQVGARWSSGGGAFVILLVLVRNAFLG